jgi:hypothetical protein
MDTDAHGARESRLCQSDEAPQSGDVLARFEPALHQAPANASRYGASQLLCGQLSDVSHFSLLMCARNRRRSVGVAQRAEMIRTTSSSRSVQTTRTRQTTSYGTDGDETIFVRRVNIVE